MKLSFKQIKDISFGAYRITEENGILTYEKCTDKQTEAMKICRNGAVLGHSIGSTGCCLDFHTDSDIFSFLPIEGARFELYINDVFTHYWVRPTDKPWDKISVDLPEGENRVMLIFPNHGGLAKISDVELADNCYFKPHSYKLKMAFFGDSITQGWDSKFDSLSYAWQVSRYFDAECWNAGVGGNIFYTDFMDKRNDFEPDVVIIAYGTNDFSVCKTLEEFKENLIGFLKNTAELYKDSKVFVMLPLWRGDIENWLKPWGDFKAHSMIIKEAAEGFGFDIIDAFGFIPRLREFYGDDIMLHPNGVGFGIYAQNIIKALQGKI